MKKTKLLLPLACLILITFSCTKEVDIDILPHNEQVVIDGSIETGQPPIVFVTKTNDIYSPTNFDAFLNGFISGATVSVSDGTNDIVLDELCSDNLPPGTEQMVSWSHLCLVLEYVCGNCCLTGHMSCEFALL